MFPQVMKEYENWSVRTGQDELANRREFSAISWTITKTICASGSHCAESGYAVAAVKSGKCGLEGPVVFL
jgi:hypothetical protein